MAQRDDGLTRHLGLATPLEPTYERFPLSGLPGHGDPSTNILAGRVLRDDERAHLRAARLERSQPLIVIGEPPEEMAHVPPQFAAGFLIDVPYGESFYCDRQLKGNGVDITLL